MNGTTYFLHLVWTVYLGYYHPIPWLGYLSMIPFFAIYFITLWFLFPQELRTNRKTRKKIFAFFLYSECFFNACTERIILMTLFVHTPIQMQPIWAIVLPIIRELDSWMTNKLMLKITDGTNRDAKILTSTELNCNYICFLAIILGSWATDTASYCILSVDFFINLYKCITIIRMNRKITCGDDLEKEMFKPLKEEAVQELVLIELVEILTPLVYAACVSIAYYGPNGKILGNIKNSYWMYQEIEDIRTLLTAVFRMFCLDFLAAVIGGVLLWKCSSVNGLKEVCREINYYGPFICVTLGGGVMKVHFENFRYHFC